MTTTSNTNPTLPAKTTLRIWFDADQQGSDLAYQLVRDNPGTPDPQPHQGPHADSLYFAPGEEVELQIIGSGAVKGGFDSFQLIECVIVTRPQVVQRGPNMVTRYAAPSPFLQSVGACYVLPLDFRATLDCKGELNGPERRITQDWKHSLNVGFTPGMWELSFLMTVRITRDAGTISEVRVFGFDPESEVGSTGTEK